MSHARRSFIGLALAAVITSLTACGASAPTVAPPVTMTETVVQEPVVAAPVAELTPPKSPSAAAEASDVVTPGPSDSIVMPSLLGENLQFAQDTLQAKGSFVMDQQDASGLGRIQVNDSNWQVCSQSPKPGAMTPIDAVIVLTAVKLSETCP